jgi:hypothetical protein
MPGPIILLPPIHNDPGMPERSRYLILGSTGATRNNDISPSCLQDKTQHRRLRLNVQTHANGESIERLRLAKLFAQPLQELLMHLGPVNLAHALLYEMVMG